MRGTIVVLVRRLVRRGARALPPAAQRRVREVRSALRRAGGDVGLLVRPASVPSWAQPPPLRTAAAVRLVVAPANFAGQARVWTRALAAGRDDVHAVCVAVERPLRFDADLVVPVATYRSAAWGALMERYLREQATHVLIESMRPVMGIRYGEDCAREIDVLRRAGLQVALLAHGSDVRLPSRHAELYPRSPFRDDPSDLTARLEVAARRFGAIMADFDGPRLVSTPDLLDFVPAATWLPTVVEPDRWAAQPPVLSGSGPPVVLHVPSNARLKGSKVADDVLGRLDAEGVVSYLRAESVPPEQMPALVGRADIVVEQLVLGLYSVAAIEAMAAGRAVVAHVHQRVRDRVPATLPVLEADPATLEQVVRGLAADRDRLREVAGAGPGYAEEVHDGRRSAAVLSQWVDGGP